MLIKDFFVYFVYFYENPVGMIKAVRGIIYDGLTEKEAMEVYNTTKSAKLE